MHQPVSVSPSTDGTFALIRIVEPSTADDDAAVLPVEAVAQPLEEVLSPRSSAAVTATHPAGPAAGEDASAPRLAGPIALRTRVNQLRRNRA